MRVLVVEDEQRLAALIAEGLRDQGMAVDVSHDGDDALEKVELNAGYDVLVLDRDLPGRSGDEVCAELAGRPAAPMILMLTALSGTDDRVDGLSLGADDYLGKPFSFAELTLRIRSLGRRRGPHGVTLVCGDLTMDTLRRTVHRAGPAARADREGVRRAAPAAGRRRRGAQPGGAAGAGLGRERRPVHQHRARHGQPAAPQARRPRHDRDPGGRRLPDRTVKVSRRRPAWLRLPARLRRPALPALTVRARLTLTYAALFILGGSVLVLALTTAFYHEIFRPLPPSAVPSRLDPDHDHILGLSDQIRDAAASRLLGIALLLLLAVVALSALVGWWVAGRLLRPVAAITAAARRASDTTLHERLNLSGPADELKELGDTFDQMLERLDAAFAAQRRFVANASHELRTPLAVTRAAVEVTLAKPAATEAQWRAMAADVAHSTDNAQRLIAALLVLARSEQGVTDPVEDDLADLAAEALDQVAARSRERRLRLETDLAPAPLRANLALLGIAVSNLLENAVRYNREGGLLRVSTARDGPLVGGADRQQRRPGAGPGTRRGPLRTLPPRRPHPPPRRYGRPARRHRTGPVHRPRRGPGPRGPRHRPRPPGRRPHRHPPPPGRSRPGRSRPSGARPPRAVIALTRQVPVRGSSRTLGPVPTAATAAGRRRPGPPAEIYGRRRAGRRHISPAVRARRTRRALRDRTNTDHLLTSGQCWAIIWSTSEGPSPARRDFGGPARRAGTTMAGSESRWEKRQRIRTHLLDLVEETEAGHPIPGERQLCATLGVSRPTLRSVVDDLVRDGALVRAHGRGVFVAKAKVAQRLAPAGEDTAGPAGGGVDGIWTSRTVDFRDVPAGPGSAGGCGMAPSERCCGSPGCGRGRRPDGVETLHVPRALVPGLTAHDLETHSFYRLLGRPVRVLLTDAAQSIEPTVIDETEAELLGVPAHTPALLFERGDQGRRRPGRGVHPLRVPRRPLPHLHPAVAGRPARGRTRRRPAPGRRPPPSRAPTPWSFDPYWSD